MIDDLMQATPKETINMIFFIVIVFLTAVAVSGYGICICAGYLIGDITYFRTYHRSGGSSGERSDKERRDLWKHIGLLIADVVGTASFIVAVLKMFSII